MDENHIEGARVYIDTLADSPKHCKQTVVHMTGIGGETCTAEMLQAITSGDWLNGAVSMSLVLTKISFVLHKLIEIFCLCMQIINAYCKHL